MSVSSNSKQVYGNIVELGYYQVPCNSQMCLDLKNGKVYTTSTPVNLNLIGLGDCTDETRIENKQVIHTVKLTAQIRIIPDDLVSTRCMFYFRTADGRKYIIGGVDRPYPSATVKECFPGDFNNPSGFTLNVEYQGVHGVLILA